MKEEKVVAFAVMAFLWLSSLAVAPSRYGETILTENVLDVLQLPEDWVSSLSNIITLIIAPFLAVTAIIYGLLTEMRIFRRGYGAWKINLIISVCAVLTSMYLGWFRTTVTFLLGIVGIWGTAVFFGLFFIGSIALIAIRISGWRGEYGAEEAARSVTDELRGYGSRIAELESQYGRTTDPNKRAQIENELTKLENKRTDAAARRRQLREGF